LTPVDIEIVSDAAVPTNAGPAIENRRLGIRVFEITLACGPAPG
jgi:hypothetical protein